MEAPLGRAVIGGLVMSTFATLLVLPSIFALVIGRKEARSPSLYPGNPESAHYDPHVDADGRRQRPRGRLRASETRTADETRPARDRRPSRRTAGRSPADEPVRIPPSPWRLGDRPHDRRSPFRPTSELTVSLARPPAAGAAGSWPSSRRRAAARGEEDCPERLGAPGPSA